MADFGSVSSIHATAGLIADSVVPSSGAKAPSIVPKSRIGRIRLRRPTIAVSIGIPRRTVIAVESAVSKSVVARVAVILPVQRILFSPVQKILSAIDRAAGIRADFGSIDSDRRFIALAMDLEPSGHESGHAQSGDYQEISHEFEVGKAE